jgi:hypothetical protein
MTSSPAEWKTFPWKRQKSSTRPCPKWSKPKTISTARAYCLSWKMLRSLEWGSFKVDQSRPLKGQQETITSIKIWEGTHKSSISKRPWSLPPNIEERRIQEVQRECQSYTKVAYLWAVKFGLQIGAKTVGETIR